MIFNDDWENNCLCLEDGIKPAAANLINLQSIYSDCLEGEYMININATIRWKGYNPNDLKSTSGKRVWANCDICGKGRWIEYRHDSPVCRSCALTGLKRSDESKRKMSVARTGIKLSNEHKQNIRDAAEKLRMRNIPTEYVCSECGVQITRYAVTGKCRGCARLGKPLSQAHKDAISEGNTGKVLTEDHRRRMSISKKGTQAGKNNPMYGRNHTEESKRKMSKTRMSKPGAGIKKIKQISSFIEYNGNVGKEVVWRQKIDENGRLQGIGCFLIRKPGKMSLEKRRASSRHWRPIMEAQRRGMNFNKISFEHPDCQWHHVTNDHVVSMPIHIHQKVYHKLNDGNILEGVLG